MNYSYLIIENIEYGSDSANDLSEDEQLKRLDFPLCDSDEESDEYYSNYELETESSIWKHMSSPWFNYLFEETKKQNVVNDFN